jgi:hypothetical protein
MSRTQKRGVRPSVEALEDRCVLDGMAVYTWPTMPMPTPTPTPMPSPQPTPTHHSHHARAAHKHHHVHHTVVMGAHAPAMTGMMAMRTMM